VERRLHLFSQATFVLAGLGNHRIASLIGAAGSSNYAEEPKYENDHYYASQRNRQVHTSLQRPCRLNLKLVERNAVKGEWKDRRLGWINSDSIPISIPTPSPYARA
jgi:hypothetical protein